MSIRTLSILALMLLAIHAFAQESKVDVSYQYMHENQWDNAIHTYNFSRPFLAEPQPLFAHGLGASVSHIFKNEHRLKHGANLAYSFFRSSAENYYLNNTLHLHFIKLGYLFHFEDPRQWKGLYSELILSATSSGLFRNVNRAPFVYDEAWSKAFGIGLEIHLKLGYSLKLNRRTCLSPWISAGYAPYFYSPGSEGVINQTQRLSTKSWTRIFTAQIGLAFHLRKQRYR
jgi:hypothetical protein